MAYSEDFRKRALEYMDEGHTYTELYEAFKIYPSAIEDWRKLLAETGSLKPQYTKTRKRKIDKDKLSAAVKEKPDSYLYELAKPYSKLRGIRPGEIKRGLLWIKQSGCVVPYTRTKIREDTELKNFHLFCAKYKQKRVVYKLRKEEAS